MQMPNIVYCANSGAPDKRKTFINTTPINSNHVCPICNLNYKHIIVYYQMHVFTDSSIHLLPEFKLTSVTGHWGNIR